MAKKKKEKVKEELDDDGFGDLEDDLFEDDKVEIAVPKISKDKEESAPAVEEGVEGISDEEEEEEDLPYEEEIELPDYKYLDVDIVKGDGNDYELLLEGQSHGLLNIMVKHLLEVEGVQIAAYKVIRIEPPKIFIRLSDEKYKIKKIISSAIDTLRAEVIKVQEVFQKLM